MLIISRTGKHSSDSSNSSNSRVSLLERRFGRWVFFKLVNYNILVCIKGNRRCGYRCGHVYLIKPKKKQA